MNRREFLGWVGVGGVASSLPVALAACSNPSDRSGVSTSPPPSDGFVTVGTVTELEQKGQLSQGQVLVVPSPSDPQQVVAVNPTCTHAGCTVAWQKDQKVFACSCHGSQFGSDGQVLKGPAEKPLATYTTQLDGDTILVKMG